MRAQQITHFAILVYLKSPWRVELILESSCRLASCSCNGPVALAQEYVIFLGDSLLSRGHRMLKMGFINAASGE